MGIIEQGPYIGLQDSEGRLRVVLDPTRPDGPSVCVMDERAVIRGRMLVNNLGSFLSLLDTKGKTRVGMGLTEKGGGLTLLDENGKEPSHANAALAQSHAGNSASQGLPRLA